MSRYVTTRTQNEDGSVTTVTSRHGMSGFHIFAALFLLIALGFLAISFATANAIQIPCKIGTEHCVPVK